MKILLDECFPVRAKLLLNNHFVETATERGWKSLKNGELLKAAVQNEFDFFLTIDKNLEFQQNLKAYRITVVVFDIRKSKIELLQPLLPKFTAQLDTFEKERAYKIQ